MKEEIWPLLLVVLFIFGGIFLFSVLKPMNIQKKKNTPVKKSQDFLIHNHLPNHPIKIDILEAQRDTQDNVNWSEQGTVYHPQKTLIHFINKGTKHYLSNTEANQYFKSGNVLRIYIWDQNKNKHFSDYLLDTEKYQRIKQLHIGMITARSIGSTDVYRDVGINANAGQGQPWIKIHNLSKIPLYFNKHIEIKPNSQYRYQGYMHMGVPLGTILKEDSGLYSDYQYLKPYTDLYFGVTSDIEQSDGCWQISYDDNCGNHQTLWPLEEGVY